MGQPSPFCNHQPDRASCETALVAAWEAGVLEEHCITKGLRKGYGHCEEVIRLGFLQQGNKALLSATEKVLLWSFREDVAAGKSIFEEMLRRYILWVIWQYGVRNQDDIEDVYQQTYLTIENAFRGPERLRAHVRPYIWTLARNQVFAFRRRRRMEKSLELVDESPVFTVDTGSPIPQGVLGYWETLDQMIALTRKHDLIDRIILAQLYALNWAEGERLATRELLANWARLGALSGEEISIRTRELAQGLACSGDRNPVHVCAALLNQGVIEAWEVPLVFAVCSDRKAAQVAELLARLASSSVGFVDLRVFRFAPLFDKRFRACRHENRCACFARQQADQTRGGQHGTF